MKILITGSRGFIGKNFISHVKEMENIEIITFDHEDNLEKIETNIKGVDYIFHFAGVNRPKNIQEFYDGNQHLTEEIIDILVSKKLSIPIIMTSSIQADLNNDYGKSKKGAEIAIRKYNNGSRIYRLHNVFGKWCKPNYNSVVATFCNNIACGKEIEISDRSKEIELIYIDDICKEFKNILLGKSLTQQTEYYYISPRYKITLGQLADKIYEFKKSAESIYVPNTNSEEFTKKLYSTFISYLPNESLKIPLKINNDERGSFTELVKNNESGQVSVSVSKPGVIRGNHYHHTKMERFIVIKGEAKITFQNITTDETFSIYVSDKKLEVVNIPVGYSHSIENTGQEEMILIIWCNEIYDETKPDTYYKEILK